MNAKMKPTVQQRVQARLNLRVQQQAQAMIFALMQTALKRANKGVMPSAADVKENAKVFDNPRTGQMQVWWLGETVLLLTPSAEGMKWQFMGSAADDPAQVAQAAGG